MEFEVIQRSRRFSADHIVILDLSRKAIKASVGIQVLRSTTLLGIERLLFPSASSRGKILNSRANVTVATPEEENEAAHVIQDFLTRRHQIRQERIMFDNTPLIALWKSWNQRCTNRKSFILGPLVELVYALDGQRRRVQRVREALRKKMLSKATAPGDVSTIATNIEALK